MAATRNTDAISNQQPSGGSGEFHARRDRDEPLTSHGVSPSPFLPAEILLTRRQHQPGKLVGNDAVPEFTAKTLPPGSAPADRTFRPNNASEVPPVQQNLDNVDADAPQTSAADTIPGATSQQVHTGLGHPGQGQTSNELRHDGQSHRKNPGASLEGVGVSGAKGKTVDARQPEFSDQRALDKDEAQVGRGNAGGPGAEERIPESAETVANERV